MTHLMSGHRNVWKILVMVTGLSSITGVEAGEGAPFTEQQKADAVVRLLKRFGGSDPHALDVVDQHRYVQHNPRVEDGLAGLEKRLATLPLGSHVKVVRVLADGDFIITHSAIARRNTGPSSINITALVKTISRDSKPHPVPSPNPDSFIE